VDRPDGEHVWPVLEAAFREYGLPRAIRSDNGPPFASTGAGGLSSLAVKLIKAGVRPERIRPGKPQQNGVHERMHLTVKRETASPPAPTLHAQQRRFDSFRRAFNEERPHEALDQETPAEHFQPSGRAYGGRLREPEYDKADQVRRVHLNGDIKWRGERVFVSTALIGEPIGMFETADGSHHLFFGPVLLGRLDRSGTFKKDTSQPEAKPLEHDPKVLPM
jgi:putative transposase